jgi:hypothetical protein
MLGWLFVIIVIAALGGVLYVATRPMVELSGHIRTRQAH